MRIDRLTLRNFKHFEHREFVFHPQFNLIAGDNGTGKTSVLDALAVAAGSWLLGIRGQDSRHINVADVRLQSFHDRKADPVDASVAEQLPATWEKVWPCEVIAHGNVQQQELSWKRALNSPKSRTTYADAKSIKDLAVRTDSAIRQAQSATLPLISYYGTGRLWQVPRESYRVASPERLAKKQDSSRFEGYRNSVDPRLSVERLTDWFARQSWIAFQQQGREPPAFDAARAALLDCLRGAKWIEFDATLGEVVVRYPEGLQPFSNLSDGRRSMLALVGDLAQKAATLNPHLGDRVLQDTPGLVLIDELDLHLHPRWQREVIEDLRKTFPAMQFICTTHSPFLIQSLRSGEELILLDGQPTSELGNLTLEQIAEGIQGVSHAETSLRYQEMQDVAYDYLSQINAAEEAPQPSLATFKAQLASKLAPYADNPAFQTFLEMQQAARLGT